MGHKKEEIWQYKYEDTWNTRKSERWRGDLVKKVVLAVAVAAVVMRKEGGKTREKRKQEWRGNGNEITSVWIMGRWRRETVWGEGRKGGTGGETGEGRRRKDTGEKRQGSWKKGVLKILKINAG